MKVIFPGSCINKVCFFIIFLLLSFIVFTGFKATAQRETETEGLFVTAFTIEHGLRQSMVSQVCQDNLGLIWMVTGDGLQYFDGQEFKVFRLPGNKTNNHTDNVMRYLIAPEPGRLVLSSSSSLLTFNTVNGEFKTIFRREGFCPIIFKTQIDKKPLVWIAGLDFCMVNNTKLEKLKLVFKNGDGIPACFIPSDAVRTSADEILVCGETGIIALNLSERISDSVFNAVWYPLADCRSEKNGKRGNIDIGRKQTTIMG